ncbi:class I SAM-dependent methyltransferase [Deinococcus sonorensis]|uniref:Class I SAM-dependent methyltransferase n=2 Tax=Deinococcus sonorensis TaxID=309891 RepID=A0AAU7UE63_9DEIO
MEPLARVLDFYQSGQELERLTTGLGRLEAERTRALITRFQPSSARTVLDVGGGPGAHALWLAASGLEVHLLDAVPLHVEAALRRSAAAPRGLASAVVGDARALPYPDATADMVLLLGPLYHLTDPQDWANALTEAFRCVRPGGVVFAAAIHRGASTVVGAQRGWVLDQAYLGMLEREWITGEHRRPAEWPRLLVDAHFHSPQELTAELETAGFSVERVFGLEGPGWLMPDFSEAVQDPETREKLLWLASLLEDEPALSPHILAVATRPT